MTIRRVVNSGLCLVAYDIPDDRRRRRIAAILSGFGARMQWSVFECWTDPGVVPSIAQALRRETDPANDKVSLIPIAPRMLSECVHLGTAAWHRPPPFWIIGRFSADAADARDNTDEAG